MADPLTYQEMLRTLGTLLDDCRCTNAVIRVSPQGAEIIAPGWRGDREQTIEEIRRQSAIQRGWRAQRRTQSVHPEGLRWSLRVVGAELDAVGARSYVLTVQPDGVRVQSGERYDRHFSTSALKRRAMLALHLRGQIGPSRPSDPDHPTLSEALP